MSTIKTPNHRLPFNLWMCAAVLATPVSTTAVAEVTLECAAGEFGPEVSLHYDADRLSVTDSNGTADLTASMRSDPSGIFTIVGSGPMDAQMPDPAALDSCIAAQLKQLDTDAEDADSLGYAANRCRVKLTPDGTMQNVEADLIVTSIDPGQASLFIQRQYLAPSAVTGKPIQLDEFPLRECKVLTGP